MAGAGDIEIIRPSPHFLIKHPHKFQSAQMPEFPKQLSQARGYLRHGLPAWLDMPVFPPVLLSAPPVSEIKPQKVKAAIPCVKLLAFFLVQRETHSFLMN